MWLDGLFILASVVVVLSIVLSILFELTCSRLGTLEPVQPNGDPSSVPHRVSVVIPARNEEEDIERALQSVLAQRDVQLQVIVINDQSTDATGEILCRIADADPRITLIENPPLRKGWMGKPNAMRCGEDAATSELILFTDADVVHSPTAVATGISVLERDGLDFLSLFPRIECRSFWENVFIPLSLVPFLSQFATGRVNDPKSAEAWGAGAFMLMKRDVLRDVGGMASIKSAILDDTELARTVKRSGYRIGYHFGPELVRVRMFKGNRQVFRSPVKNVIALSFDLPWMALPAMLLPFIFFWLPWGAVTAGLWSQNALLTLVGLLQPVVMCWLLVRLRGICDFRWPMAICFPLITLPTVAVLARAFYEQQVRRTLVWRERSIALDGGGDNSD